MIKIFRYWARFHSSTGVLLTCPIGKFGPKLWLFFWQISVLNSWLKWILRYRHSIYLFIEDSLCLWKSIMLLIKEQCTIPDNSIEDDDWKGRFFLLSLKEVTVLFILLGLCFHQSKCVTSSFWVYSHKSHSWLIAQRLDPVQCKYVVLHTQRLGKRGGTGEGAY